MKTIGVLLALLAGLTLADCGSADEGSTLQVLAAASLTEPFTAMEKTYEQEHPGVDVVLSFDSSAILAEQLSQGLVADVLATADQQTMDEAAAADVVAGTPEQFATNTLVIATPAGNPGGIKSLDDLDGATFAVCVPAAPCGDATQRLFELDRFSGKPATEEENVKGVLTKVTSGEVDAGLVYASDAMSASAKVDVVRAENASEVVTVDSIAAIEGSENSGAAKDWIDLVTGTKGQEVLGSHGFGPRP